ncbi:MAG TPA: carbohydrate ABC transporter permease [Polyangiaceae bacterium]|nr:carbohydrate ABC transporter permease [Polyangiaceae bacterium]
MRLAVIWRWLRLAVLLSAAGAVLAPFAWLIAAAFKDKAVLNEYVFFPPPSEWSQKTLNLDNFRALFAGDAGVEGTVRFWQYGLNSLFLASATTTLQLVFCSMAGYALAKFEFRGKRWLLGMMLGSMMIPGVLLLSPIYELMVTVGLVDSFSSLLLPCLATAYGCFLFRQACLAVPSELIDAGRIDGCSELRIYFSLVMPLVRPMSAAFCLVTFLGTWNAFFGPSVFLHAQSELTLPVILNRYLGVYTNQYGVFLAGTLLAIVPPAILFFALERELIDGLTSGAVKG